MPPSDGTNAIESRALTRRFGEFLAVGAVDFEGRTGEVFGYLGANGAGKSTTIRMLCGLLTPSSGEATVAGHVVAARSSSRELALLRGAIGYMSQKFSLYGDLSVDDNLAFFGGAYGLWGRALTMRADEPVARVDLADVRKTPTRELPGGMRQRVNRARALAFDPDILLMDEPFSALDAQTREIMQTELLRIWEQGRKTVLFVTHQIDEAVFLSDRVLVFARRPGRVQETVEVTLPRPRTLAMKRTPEFVAYVDRIWRLIEDDVRASVIEERG